MLTIDRSVGLSIQPSNISHYSCVATFPVITLDLRGLLRRYYTYYFRYYYYYLALLSTLSYCFNKALLRSLVVLLSRVEAEMW